MNAATPSQAPNPLDRNTWPNRTKAAEMRGCSVTTIRNLEKRGTLTPVSVNGEIRYDPLQLEAADTQATDLTSAELIAAAANLVRQSQQHNEQLLALVTVPAKQAQDQLSRIHELQNQRIELLEKKNAEMSEAAESNLQAQHERLMDERRFEAGERRKGELLQTALKHIPDVAKAAINRIVGMATGKSSAAPESAQARAEKQTPPSGQNSQNPANQATSSTSPPATSPETSSSSKTNTSPEIDPDEAAFQVHCVLARLPDDQIDMMANAGFIDRGEAVAFKAYRRQMEKDDAKARAASADAIDTTGEPVADEPTKEPSE